MWIGVVATLVGWFVGNGKGLFWFPLSIIAFIACKTTGPIIAVLAFVLAWSSASDIRNMEVPDTPWCFAGIIWLLKGGTVSRLEGLAACIIGYFFGIFLQRFSEKEFGMVGYGGADIKLQMVAGLYIGLFGMWIGLAIGATIGLIQGRWLIRKNNRGSNDPLPFIPALSIGFMLGAICSTIWRTAFCI